MKIASALDYLEGVQTVVKKINSGGMHYLAKTAAAFMLMQFMKMRWENPDLIVPVPRRFWFEGTNHPTLLAKVFAKQIDVKVKSIVGKRVGDLCQGFYLKKPSIVEGKTILIIDDVMITGTTLRHTAEALKEGLPKKIYALTFARAANLLP